MLAEQPAREVLRHYPAAGATLTALGNRGGFSGARLWRTLGPAGELCLRAWPTTGPTVIRLRFIHEQMGRARDAGLGYVPALCRTGQGATWVEHAGRLWELTTWLPGRADFHERPTPVRLAAVCTALAGLHAAWSRSSPGLGPCPAIRQRLECARDWLGLVRSGWEPPLATRDSDPALPWARRAWDLLLRHAPRLEGVLGPWLSVPVRLQPCLCDVWHDHLLFEGDRLTGIVDYGSVKVNHVAADLARMLGSLVCDDRERQEAGLAAYRQLQPLSAEESELVGLLDRTGTVLAATNWLRWLYHERRQLEDRTAAAGRLATIVQRLQSWEA